MNNRRTFLRKSISLAALPFVPRTALSAEPNPEAKLPEIHPEKHTIFFDVNETLLDLEPLKKAVVQKLGGNEQLGTLWFTTMLQYSLVASAADQYIDFGKIGAAALVMVAKNNGIAIPNDEALQTIKPILSLKPHPEIIEALELLKNNGFKLVSFTNSSNKAVAQQLKNAGLEHFFTAQISVEDFGKFKPERDVYHWAARKMSLENPDCILVAAHGWDVAGAKWAGWKTAFIARKGQQLFPLAPQPDINQPDLLRVAHEIISSVKG